MAPRLPKKSVRREHSLMGAFEEAKGKIKKAAADVTGSEGLRQEGQQQEEKGREQREAEEARAQAQAHEREAEGHEQRERSEQGT
ncbi:hypothetical protein Francci3_1985 [Frankia casuarinae]|uniref:CsbD-like n=2 Tax=Frankiaceae TaxID=74712 RepID=Q2JBI3_FRACC|nr:hypothetical protein Francci3_1985 [Frankia casuarinae]